MSHEIVKSIKIKDNKVFLTSACNNVFPRTPHEWECSPLSKLLQEKGKKALDIAIFEDYENGNMQAGGKNKYTRALEVLRHLPEYKAFDWRVNRDEYEKNQKNRENIPALHELLSKALETKLPKEKYAITKEYNTQR